MRVSFKATDEWQITGKNSHKECEEGVGSQRASTAASVLLGIDSPSLQNCAGEMNALRPKLAPSFGVLMRALSKAPVQNLPTGVQLDRSFTSLPGCLWSELLDLLLECRKYQSRQSLAVLRADDANRKYVNLNGGFTPATSKKLKSRAETISWLLS